jgi:formylglycine-generating enzyme required for sulfatase activity
MPLLILSLVGKAAAPTNPWHAGWVATTAIHDIVRENDHGMKMAANYLRRKGYRLPTEAEWEYACRAGAATGFSFGESDDLVGKYAWQSGNSYEKSNRVGSLRPNDYGLFDMHGNACEWCQDRFTGKKQEEDTEDMSSTKTSRVIRGGAFSTSAPAARFGYRDQYMPTIRTENVGFRPARTFLP